MERMPRGGVEREGENGVWYVLCLSVCAVEMFLA